MACTVRGATASSAAGGACGFPRVGADGRCEDYRMDVPPPFAELPEEVCFTLDEVADVLFTVDVAVEQTAPGTSAREVARRSQRLITSRLWPELGDLLGDDDAEEE